jgi:hypothetical protein
VGLLVSLDMVAETSTALRGERCADSGKCFGGAPEKRWVPFAFRGDVCGDCRPSSGDQRGLEAARMVSVS